jgi:hypothetical protein
VGTPGPGVPVAVAVVGTVEVGPVVIGVVDVGSVAVPLVVGGGGGVVVVVVVGEVVVVARPVAVAVDAELVPAVNPPRGPRTVAPPGVRCTAWLDWAAVGAEAVEPPAGAAIGRAAGAPAAVCDAEVAAATPVDLGAE